MRSLRFLVLPILFGALLCVASMHLSAAPTAADTPAATPAVEQLYPYNYNPYSYGNYSFPFQYNSSLYSNSNYNYPYQYYYSYPYNYGHYPYSFYDPYSTIRSWQYCTIPGGGAIWVLGATTVGLDCS